MRACRSGPFKKWSVLLRITAYYRVLPRIKRSVLPLGAPRTPRFPGKSGGPAWGAKGVLRYLHSRAVKTRPLHVGSWMCANPGEGGERGESE